jgi:DNA-binding NtrC family response regulator
VQRAATYDMRKDSSRRQARAGVAAASPTIVLFSADDDLAQLVRQAAQETCGVEHRRSAQNSSALLAQPHVRLVLVDDGAIEERERGWLLTQIRKRLPDASLLYIAADHNLENEKRARANGASYYTAKPLDAERFLQVLRSFLKVS